MLEGLQAILEKEVVLSTVKPIDLLQNAANVESTYLRHVSTFVPMGDIENIGTRLIKRVIGGQTSKGMIVAKYGYGKTSTLSFYWKQCEKEGLVATPPFYCSTLLDILEATYGWTRYRLENVQPDLVAELDEIYRKYTDATVEQMAAKYSQDHGIALLTATNMLTAMLRDGRLVLELTPANLLFFLDSVDNLVIRARFKGLVVFIDEFQQYFSKTASLRGAIQEFRELIWGLDTRSNSLGVFLSIPTYTEGVIQEQGKDIIDRLKKDGLYYRLQDIYTLDFPEKLWDQYVKEFSLKDISDRVIDRYTLQAIGQIAERDDLGEGPRTVIDSMKRAIVCFQDEGRAYSPIDLVDDFLNSTIRFQAQANKIKAVVKESLGSNIVDTPDKQRAIKLMAAYPRGCPHEAQNKYKLREVIVNLSKQSRGQLMVNLVGGETLIGLSRTGGPTHIVDIIITNFWNSYEEDELHTAGVIQAFTDRLLPRFFETQKGSAIIGWGDLDFVPSPKGGYIALVEGTHSARYPHRRLGLQVVTKEEQLTTVPNADLQFDFILSQNADGDHNKLSIESDRLLQLNLNMKQRMGTVLPDDVQKLQEFILPEYVTPFLMLGLVRYFDTWHAISEQPISEGDRPEVDYFIGRLVGQTVQLLFNQALGNSMHPPLQRVGGAMLEELFTRSCDKLYPNYYTFFVHAQYNNVFKDYIDALQQMTLKERRGHTNIRGSKESLASRFGVGSIATFENRIESEYANIMQKIQWKGSRDQGDSEITLKAHPLEEEILESLRGSSTNREIDGQVVQYLKSSEIADISYKYGYRDEETVLALQLLIARGYTRIEPDSKIVYLTQSGPDASDLQAQLERFEDDLENIPLDLLQTEQLSTLKSKLSAAKAQFEPAMQDDEELDELQTCVNDLNLQLGSWLLERQQQISEQLSSLQLEIEGKQISLRQADDIDKEILGQVDFVRLLNELRQHISADRHHLSDRYGELGQELAKGIRESADGPIAKTLCLHELYCEVDNNLTDLNEKRQKLEVQIEQLEKWKKLLRSTDMLFNALAKLPELRDRLVQNVIPEIQAHLSKQKLDGLADWEPFEIKIGEVEEELEKRRRYGNEEFGQIKELYEKILHEIGVDEYRPHARYTYGEDDDSYRDLYEEVRSKIEGRLNNISERVEQQKTDLLKAKYIHTVDKDGQDLIQNLEKQLISGETNLHELHRELNITLIQKRGGELDDLVKRINEVATSTDNIRAGIGPIIFADPELTPEEAEALQTLQARSEMDLTDLFIDLRHTGRDIEIQGLLSLLEHLYRKNRIIIRIRQRE